MAWTIRSFLTSPIPYKDFEDGDIFAVSPGNSVPLYYYIKISGVPCWQPVSSDPRFPFPKEYVAEISNHDHLFKVTGLTWRT